jgi:asparagine synthase (glutamine-hydrolysing)
MSGFVGVISRDGAQVDRELLKRMTAFLAYRGPDAQDLWIDGSVGLGHAMLRTTSESSPRECQPQSLDGAVWITGDVRIDGREGLISKLGSHGRHGLQGVPDAELVLHAYHTWGEDCVEHLLGDFAYAIWDARARRLFCARDHFGVKPFYYAQTLRWMVFSNTLNCIRLHPAIAGTLNDAAIGDFLLFGYNQEPTTTAFADIRRLPPAHVLTWSAESMQLRRYWSLPTDGRLEYRRPADYVDHFSELWRTAVEDRLRTDRVSVLMSGGLDSASVAVTAHERLSAQSSPFQISAHTLVYERLIPDEERHYAGLVAEKLRIPIHYLRADDYTLFGRCDEPECRTPEPSDNPVPALTADQFLLIARHHRVALSGEGGDPALSPSPATHFVNLLRARRPATLLADVVRCLAHGHRPPLGIRAAVRRWTRSGPGRPVYPPWVSQDFEARLDLRTRWEERFGEPPSLDSRRPESCRALQSPFWPSLFETYDAGVTLCPLTVRHPFFDVRLLTYLLAVPPMPWFLKKKLLRDAMQACLPEPVRRRRKTPMLADPVRALLRQPRARWINHFDRRSELVEYVDLERIPKIAGLPQQVDRYGADWHLVTRPLCLDNWLAHAASSRLMS